MPELNTYSNYLLPSFIFLLFLVGGFVAEKAILAILKKIINKTSLNHHKDLPKSFNGSITLFFLCIGLFVSISQLQLAADLKESLKSILTVVVILIATSIVSRVAVGIVMLYQDRYKGMTTSITIFANIAKLTVFTIGFLVALQTLGISITPILTALGVGGLAVALALKDSLTNLFSGLNIIASKQIKLGDYIKIGSEEGTIGDINWRSTIIKTASGNEIIVPNAKISEAIITNYSRPKSELNAILLVYLAYSNDLEKVESISQEVISSVIANNPFIDTTGKSSLKFSAFNESSITMQISLPCKSFNDQFKLKHQLLKALHKRFNSEKVIFATTSAA